MKTTSNIFSHIDWLTLVLYAMLVVFGWCNIYAVSYEPEYGQGILDFSGNSGKQFLWIITTVCLFLISSFFETRFYQSLAYVGYAFSMLLLLGTLVWGVSIGGHRAWLQCGGQPSELAKLACAMAVAKYVDDSNTPINRLKSQLILLGIILLPVVIISLQGDVGSGLVFVAFFMVFYREGLPAWFLFGGIATVAISVLTLLVPRIYLIIGTLSLALILVGVIRRTPKKVMLVMLTTLGVLFLVEGFHIFVEEVLKPHQKNRIRALVDPSIDPLGIGWNVTQSKIAIGSGGLWARVFCKEAKRSMDLCQSRVPILFSAR